MRIIPKDKIKTWGLYSNVYKSPASIHCRCSFCNELVVFTLRYSSVFHAGKIYCISASSLCPGCSATSMFSVVYGNGKHSSESDVTDVYLYPNAAKEIRGIDPDELNDVPEKLLADIKSMYNLYAMQEWESTAAKARRIMEGVMFALNIPGKDLYAKLKNLPSHNPGFGESLTQLSDSIRKIGNWGAHYSDDFTPDSEIVELMIESVEYILEYLFVLPNKAKHFKERIDSIDRKNPNNLNEPDTSSAPATGN